MPKRQILMNCTTYYTIPNVNRICRYRNILLLLMFSAYWAIECINKDSVVPGKHPVLVLEKTVLPNFYLTFSKVAEGASKTDSWIDSVLESISTTSENAGYFEQTEALWVEAGGIN